LRRFFFWEHTTSHERLVDMDDWHDDTTVHPSARACAVAAAATST
jgi:hypothetical protein